MTKPRLSSLDFLRAGCALMVLLGHLYTETGLPQHRVIFGLVSFGTESVVGFFVLSGCLISFQDYGSTARYIQARLVRIVPIYYLLLVFSAIAMLACGIAFSAWNFTANVLFVQTLYWDTLYPLRFYVQSWSLAYEFYFYAAFVAIMAVPRLLLPLLFASLAVGVAVYFIPHLSDPVSALLRGFSFFSIWLAGVVVTTLCQRGYAVSMATGAYMLVIGLCLSRVPFSHPAKFDFGRLFIFGIGFAFLVWALVSSALAASRDDSGGSPKHADSLDFGPVSRCVVSILALAVLWTWSNSEIAMKVVLTGIVVIFTIAPERLVRIVSRLVRPTLPFMFYIGGLSYALYLVHYPLLQVFNHLAVFPPIVNVLVVAASSLVAAHFLDYKFQPWVRSRLVTSRRLPNPASSHV
jgi:peptidoglycan/LPS O-acetylase OafA/YrhL